MLTALFLFIYFAFVLYEEKVNKIQSKYLVRHPHLWIVLVK